MAKITKRTKSAKQSVLITGGIIALVAIVVVSALALPSVNAPRESINTSPTYASDKTTDTTTGELSGAKPVSGSVIADGLLNESKILGSWYSDFWNTGTMTRIDITPNELTFWGSEDPGAPISKWQIADQPYKILLVKQTSPSEWEIHYRQSSQPFMRKARDFDAIVDSYLIVYPHEIQRDSVKVPAINVKQFVGDTKRNLTGGHASPAAVTYTQKDDWRKNARYSDEIRD